jgi:hypothetical protein
MSERLVLINVSANGHGGRPATSDAEGPPWERLQPRRGHDRLLGPVAAKAAPTGSRPDLHGKALTSAERRIAVGSAVRTDELAEWPRP